MFGCLTLKKYLIDRKVPLGGAIAGGLNAMQIGIGDMIFSRLAGRITDFENHRTDSEHENHLVSKTAVFRFINSFGSFFYIAFLKLPLEGKCLFDDLAKGEESIRPQGNCMGELQLQLGSIFISQMVFQNCTEVLMPMIKRHIRENKTAKESGRTPASGRVSSGRRLDDNADDLEAGRPRVKRGSSLLFTAMPLETIEAEVNREPYTNRSAFEDYAEMVLQFGFVTLFVVAFPLTPLLALANNRIEMSVDSFKLCIEHQRPAPKSASSIGMWEYFLGVMAQACVIINMALICFTSDVFQGSPAGTKFVVFLLAEHAMLAVKTLVADLMPDIPKFVVQLTERQEHTIQKIFLGKQTDTSDGLVEQAEKLQLKIHPNTELLKMTSVAAPHGARSGSKEKLSAVESTGNGRPRLVASGGSTEPIKPAKQSRISFVGHGTTIADGIGGLHQSKSNVQSPIHEIGEDKASKTSAKEMARSGRGVKNARAAKFSGFLYRAKAGRDTDGEPQWVRVFCILSGTQVTFFAASAERTLRGTTRISSLKPCAVTLNRRQVPGFVIDGTEQFCADSIAGTQAWIDAIQSTLKATRKDSLVYAQGSQSKAVCL
eukprot:g2882.t1